MFKMRRHCTNSLFYGYQKIDCHGRLLSFVAGFQDPQFLEVTQINIS